MLQCMAIPVVHACALVYTRAHQLTHVHPCTLVYDRASIYLGHVVRLYPNYLYV